MIYERRGRWIHEDETGRRTKVNTLEEALELEDDIDWFAEEEEWKSVEEM